MQCPETGRRLEWRGDGFVQPESDKSYPVVDGILDLLPEEQRDCELGDNHHYDKFPYEFVRWDDPDHIRNSVELPMREFIDETPADALIFDIGCGPGRVTAYLAQQGRNAIGLDFSSSSLRILRRNVDCPLVRANNLCLPLQDATVAAVISTGVIHHTPDPLKALSENCRVLKPGGRIYSRTYRRGSLYNFLYSVVGGAMRACRKLGAPGRIAVDNAAFGLYRQVTRVIKRGRSSDVQHLRNLFENYFLKSLVSFPRRNDLERVFDDSNLEILKYENTGQMNFYIARKRSGS